MTSPDISIVTPARNEAENLPVLVARIVECLPEGLNAEIIIVDDGSTDQTANALRRLSAGYPNVKFISFTRNFGHQAALLAGLRHASGRCIIAMDADLQHPPSLLPDMTAAWRDGADIVLTERHDANDAGRMKALTSRLYYRFLSFLADYEIRSGSADFYLIDRKVADVLEKFNEPTLFLRGILPTLGFSTKRLPYTADERRRGQSSYTIGKMIHLGLDGVLSVSIKPLRLGIVFSLIAAAIAMLYALYVVVVYFSGDAVPGWASVAFVVSAVGAMQLFVLGVVGEYIGRLLREVRSRPTYIIRETNLNSAPAPLDRPEKNTHAAIG